VGGAIIKKPSTSAKLMDYEGRVVVFENLKQK